MGRVRSQVWKYEQRRGGTNVHIQGTGDTNLGPEKHYPAIYCTVLYTVYVGNA